MTTPKSKSPNKMKDQALSKAIISRFNPIAGRSIRLKPTVNQLKKASQGN